MSADPETRSSYTRGGAVVKPERRRTAVLKMQSPGLQTHMSLGSGANVTVDLVPKPELPTYRLPGRFSVRPALRTQGEKGNDHSPQINVL